MESRSPSPSLSATFERLEGAIKTISRLELNPPSADTLLAIIAELPAEAVPRADRLLRWLPRPREVHGISTLIGRLFSVTSRLPPRSAWLYLGHSNGRLREAALREIEEPAPNPFWVAMIAARLNDWAEPVRIAAMDCASRVFDATPAAIIAAAVPHLLRQRDRYGRWSVDQSGSIDRLIGRTDVVVAVTEILATARSGAAGAVLRSALAGNSYDASLSRLARNAMLPDVRRSALDALIHRTVKLRSHREKVWIDKSMGRYRDAWMYRSRPIVSDMSAEEALALASSDNSAMVRRVAVVALLSPGLSFRNRHAILSRLVTDRNSSLRERAVFATKMGTAIVDGSAR